MNLTTEPLREWLGDLRSDPRKRQAALIGGLAVGLVLGSVHWIGLVVGGGLVGLSRRSVGRAVLAGLLFGVVATVATVALTPTVGPGEFAGLRRLAAVTAIVGASSGVWGGLVRVVI
jgi:hypothetical protein